MKSPFPGMDPFLEQHWQDVHQALTTYARDQLQQRLPGSLRARMEERVYVELEDKGRRAIHPDVRIVERWDGIGGSAELAGGVALAEPVLVQFRSEPVTEGFIEIYDASSGHRIVTVIEFLSPSNKTPGRGRELYLQKQQEIVGAEVNLVEIDLTRAGDRITVIPANEMPPSAQATYHAVVRRWWRGDTIEVYGLPLRERLPGIRIPLRPTDKDVPLDLQALVDMCYVNGRYDDIDYRRAFDPPLGAEEEAWADELLRKAGKR